MRRMCKFCKCYCRGYCQGYRNYRRRQHCCYPYPGFVASFIRWVFTVLLFASLPHVIGFCINGKYKDVDPCKYKKKQPCRNRFVDAWVLSWLTIEIAVLFYFVYNTNWIVLVIFLSLRLIGIVQTWINTSFFDIHEKEEDKPHPVRYFFLTLLNYLEGALIYAILAFLYKYDFRPELIAIRESLDYSVRTITAMGSDVTPITWCGEVLFLAETAFGLFFLIVVIQRVFAFLKSAR